MEAKKTQPETKQSAPATEPLSTSCWFKKKTDEDASFLEDLKDHIGEFIHTPMTEHKECFKNTLHTVQKMFKMPKIFAEKSSEQQQ